MLHFLRVSKLNRLFLSCVLGTFYLTTIPCFIFGSTSHLSSLVRTREKIEMEIENFDGSRECLFRILRFVDSELHFATYEEICKKNGNFD